MILIIGAAIAVILGMLFVANETNNLNTDAFSNTFGDVAKYIPDFQQNVVGDSIQFNIPYDDTNETIPVDYDIDDVSDSLFYENGTAKPPTESYITGNIASTSYSYSGVQQSIYDVVGNRMFVQIGNIASIEGQIKILDPYTKELVEPRIYKYWITIRCSDLTEFCSSDMRFYNDVTNVGGGFIERWTTNQSMNEGLYEIIIEAESLHLQENGQPYKVENTLFVELYK